MAEDRGRAVGCGQGSVKKHSSRGSFLIWNRVLLVGGRLPTIVDATVAVPTDTKKVRLESSSFIIAIKDDISYSTFIADGIFFQEEWV